MTPWFAAIRSGRLAVVLITLLLVATQIAPVSAFCGCGIDGPGCGCTTDDHASSPCGDAASGDGSATAPGAPSSGGGCCASDPLDDAVTIASSGCDTRVTERHVPALGPLPERESVSVPVMSVVPADDLGLDLDAVPTLAGCGPDPGGGARAPGVPVHLLFEVFRA